MWSTLIYFYFSISSDIILNLPLSDRRCSSFCLKIEWKRKFSLFEPCCYNVFLPQDRWEYCGIDSKLYFNSIFYYIEEPLKICKHLHLHYYASICKKKKNEGCVAAFSIETWQVGSARDTTDTHEISIPGPIKTVFYHISVRRIDNVQESLNNWWKKSRLNEDILCFKI